MSRFGDLLGGREAAPAPAPEPVVEPVVDSTPEPVVEEVVETAPEPVEVKPPAPYKSAKKTLRKK